MLVRRMVLAVLLVGGLLFTRSVVNMAFGGAASGRAAERPLAVGQAPSPGDECVNPTDGSVLVWIPGGEFVMGSDKGEPDEKPAHKIAVEGFWLGKFEVTNAQYKKFLDATGQTEPGYWGYKEFSDPNQPVVSVTYREVEAYCEWSGLRLPTEAEWEYAAAGGKQLEYPTESGQISHDLANYRGTGGKDTWDLPSPVGSFAPNPFGLYDMAGNAWEWTSSGHSDYPYSATDGRENQEERSLLRVMRGGSWYFLQRYCRTTHRHRFAAHLRYDYVGLRMALSEKVRQSNALPIRPRTVEPPAPRAPEPIPVKPEKTPVAVAPAPPTPKKTEAPVIPPAPLPSPPPVRDLTIEIVGIKFADAVEWNDGTSMTLSERGRERFRYAIVTVRMKKPAGKKLTLAAADLTLHCGRTASEVTPCEGLSSFSQKLGDDRSLLHPGIPGPGWLRQTTGAGCTQADEIFFDAVFARIKPGVSEFWLHYGQPTSQQPFVTEGWQKM